MIDFDAALAAFNEQLHDEPVVRQYFELATQIENNDELNKLREQIAAAQKNLSLSFTDKIKHEENKQIYVDFVAKYNDHPLIVNFTQIQQEVHDLLLTIKQIIE